MCIQSELQGRSGFVKIPPLASNSPNPLTPDDFQDEFTAVESSQPETLSLQPGETAEIVDINAGGIITELRVGGRFNRDLILRCYWDGQSYPSVEVPVTDFFGTGWYDPENKIPMGVATINSAMLSCSPDNGMNILFPMPFLRRARITVENRNVSPVDFKYRYSFSEHSLPDGILYFHAGFRRENPVAKYGVYTIIDGIRGRGHYVGTMLNVGINGPNLWWGEGEVKFYSDEEREPPSDGRRHPTICGTGTEDYFGGAWGWSVGGRYQPYSCLYTGVHFIHEPGGGEDMQQRFSMYRWHVCDPVTFDESLRVTIQDLGWRRNGRRYLARTDDFSSVAYWYQTLPSAPMKTLPSRDEMEVI